MEMFFESPIIKLQIQLRLPENRADNILAFVELWQINDKNEVVFKQKGITVRKKMFNEIEKITVVLPGFKTKSGFQTSFIIEQKDLFRNITKMIIEAYTNAIGGAMPPDENIDPNEIPF